MDAVLGATGMTVGPGVAAVVAVLFGVLCFGSARRFERRVGVGPWRLHPAAWLVIGLLIGIFGFALCLIAQRWGTRPRATVPSVPYPWPTAPAQMPPPNWYPDPSGTYYQRYWNGVVWTEHVVGRDGSRSIDQHAGAPSEGPNVDRGDLTS